MFPLIWKLSRFFMTPFELFLLDWWLVINSSILLKRGPHYHPNINPSREELQSQVVRILCSSFTDLSKLKGSASDTLRMAFQKTEGKEMNYVRSLLILHFRRGRPACPLFPVSNKAWIGMRSNQHNAATVNSPWLFFIPSYRCEVCRVGSSGFSEGKAFCRLGEGKTITVILNEICIWDVDFDNTTVS